MKLYRIAGKITDEQLSGWIKELVNRDYGGEEGSTEGWCGEVAGDIYKYLKAFGESPEMWGLVNWIDEDNQPAVIEYPSAKMLEDIDNQTTGVIGHSFVKWNGKFWDGKGIRNIEQITAQHGFGLGKGDSLIKEW